MFAVLGKLVVAAGILLTASIAVWQSGHLRQWSVATFGSPRTAAETKDTAPPAEKPAIPGTAGQRFLVWTLFVLVTPILTAPVAMRVLAKESNAANVVLLFGYTGLDVLAAHLVGGIRVGGILSGAFYLIALLAVFAYNLWICTFLARLQEKSHG